MNIIVYGAGQLGSRHLQGLTGIASNHKIYAYDPSKASLDIALKRWKETGSELPLELISDINLLQNLNFDLAIIATNAKHRLGALKVLLERNCKLFILEKVLFQKAEEYDVASDLLKKHDARAWVNCPRRLFDHYEKVKELIAGNDEIHMSVTGSDWGMACNAIHFLDLFAWLSNEIHFEGFTDGLYPEISESKRSGYYEINGTLSFFNESRTLSLHLNCRKEGSPGVWIRISSKSYVIEVNESLGEMIIWDGKISATEPIKPKFQSMITGEVVNNILNENICITTFDESQTLHLNMIKSLNTHFGRYKPEFGNVCPIT